MSAFPADAVVWTDGEYSYRAGYFVAAGCMGLCALTAVGLMLFKCRGRKGRKTVWLPPILILLCGIYCVLYVLKISDHTSLLFYLAGDLTAALCLMFAGTLESCLQAGLIASNTGYEGLFRVVSVGIRIVDKTGNTHYASETAQPLSREELVRAERGETLESGALRIKALPIRGGYAVWQEDVAELMRVQAELNEIREELQDRNELLRDQYRQDAQRYRLEEQISPLRPCAAGNTEEPTQSHRRPGGALCRDGKRFAREKEDVAADSRRWPPIIKNATRTW